MTKAAVLGRLAVLCLLLLAPGSSFCGVMVCQSRSWVTTGQGSPCVSTGDPGCWQTRECAAPCTGHWSACATTSGGLAYLGLTVDHPDWGGPKAFEIRWENDSEPIGVLGIDHPGGGGDQYLSRAGWSQLESVGRYVQIRWISTGLKYPLSSGNEDFGWFLRTRPERAHLFACPPSEPNCEVICEGPRQVYSWIVEVMAATVPLALLGASGGGVAQACVATDPEQRLDPALAVWSHIAPLVRVVPICHQSTPAGAYVSSSPPAMATSGSGVQPCLRIDETIDGILASPACSDQTITEEEDYLLRWRTDLTGHWRGMSGTSETGCSFRWAQVGAAVSLAQAGVNSTHEMCSGGHGNCWDNPDVVAEVVALASGSPTPSPTPSPPPIPTPTPNPTPTPSPTPAEEYVGYWRLDEGAELVTVDALGDSAALVAGAGWTDGQRGAALLLDGVDDRAESGTDDAYDITGDLTVALWFRRDGLGSQGSAYPVSKGDCWNSPCPWGVRVNGGVCLEQSNRVNGLDRFCAGTAPPLGTWAHLALVRQGMTRRIYIDGALVGSSSAQGQAPTANDGVLIIGSKPAAQVPTEGAIDEVAIYARALTESEIATLRDGL